MDDLPPFAVEVARHPEGRTVVSVTGELDVRSSPEVRRKLLDALTADVVVLDMSACTFCGSSGVRMIAEVGRRAGEAHSSFRVAGLTGVPARAFELAQIKETLSLFPDVNAALDA